MPSSAERVIFTALAPKHRYVLGPEEVNELRELFEELPYASMRAAASLRANGKPMRGDDLLPFFRAESAVAEILQRIREILEN